MTYKSCKLLITKKAYTSKEDMQNKLDIFLAFNRLKNEEYEELTNLLNAVEM